jgi:hypothetical protein
VPFVAPQVADAPERLEGFEWSGRSAKRRRVEIRRFLGCRECSAEDFERLTGWLAAEVRDAERDPSRVRFELVGRCLSEMIEPPSDKQVQRLVRSALHRSEQSMTEVAAMADGAIRHGTTMDVEANYNDTHGQSEIGFRITRLLGFDLLPRIKRINPVRLYRPAAGTSGQYPALEPALIRPSRWDVIAEQYDQIIR